MHTLILEGEREVLEERIPLILQGLNVPSDFALGSLASETEHL